MPPDAASNGTFSRGDQHIHNVEKGNDVWCRDHQLRPYTFREALDLIRSFHGHIAPGLVLGLKMVDLARRRLADGILYDALCETTSCLPVAVQMLTPCTVGNNWLKVMDLGKFGLTLYDKANGRGIRVSLDPARLSTWPQLCDWFYKRKSKSDQDFDALLEDIRQAGSDCLSLTAVEILPVYRTHRSKGPIITCPQCGEAYPETHGTRCRGCQGQAPYIQS
jgi:formylmethanofuran dehydrogenase subunit E